VQDHNLGTIGGLTVTLEICDVATFTGGTFQTLATWTPGSSNARLASLSLKHTGAVALRYSGLIYVRLKMTKGSTFTPEIGELWLGRRQLLHKGNWPYDDLGLASRQRTFETASGRESGSVANAGRRIISASINPSDTTAKSDVQAWFRECNYGTRAFLWVENPNSYPAQYNRVRLDSPELAFPSVGPFERETTIRAVEQGPDFLDPEVN